MDEKTVTNGSRVKVHYTGTLETGEQFDSSVGKEALAFQIGAGQIIPGFEEAVLGMKVGEKKKITLPPEQAYGERNETLKQEVPRESVQGKMDLEVGKMIGLRGPTGQVLFAKIESLTDDKVVLDFNPPLAGKTLIFEIELVSIE